MGLGEGRVGEELVITGRKGEWGGRSLVSLFQQEDHSWREKGVGVKWRQDAGLEGPLKETGGAAFIVMAQ